MADADLFPVMEELVNLYRYAGNDPLNVTDEEGFGGFFDKLKVTIIGTIIERAIAGREIDPKTLRPKGSPTQQVEAKKPPEQDESPASGGNDEPSDETKHVVAEDLEGVAALAAVADALVLLNAFVGGGAILAF